MIVCEKCIGMAQTKPTYQYSWQVPGGGWERCEIDGCWAYMRKGDGVGSAGKGLWFMVLLGM
ncbi:uncharacterized protein ANIA_01816 [Aspergillus nidulans FGSC A4]|uniref:Uncharacterized protein n=1 Tax=Emericella nidulans (strain FGSC A4 / ATCC 38163 / CBS 112.46 / NRRL 194 / M139) TaxID=227321 RepID=C8VPM6_EMENI|nr:hypothetical protein [Aspergillus nidulans FGSC A4]CBF85616.1 TPA: hypothetical protein ANIA_01816 [Aspergillus nidulans FGSC A4]